jgi:hypothetical protein
MPADYAMDRRRREPWETYPKKSNVFKGLIEYR